MSNAADVASTSRTSPRRHSMEPEFGDPIGRTRACNRVFQQCVQQGITLDHQHRHPSAASVIPSSPNPAIASSTVRPRRAPHAFAIARRRPCRIRRRTSATSRHTDTPDGACASRNTSRPSSRYETVAFVHGGPPINRRVLRHGRVPSRYTGNASAASTPHRVAARQARASTSASAVGNTAASIATVERCARPERRRSDATPSPTTYQSESTSAGSVNSAARATVS